MAACSGQLVLPDRGEVVVVAATGEFKVLARNHLGEDSQSTPTVAGGRMYLRALGALISIGGKTSKVVPAASSGL